MTYVALVKLKRGYTKTYFIDGLPSSVHAAQEAVGRYVSHKALRLNKETPMGKPIRNSFKDISDVVIYNGLNSSRKSYKRQVYDPTSLLCK